MINLPKIKILLFFIVPIISLIGGIWHGQFINDGYHWGFIFSNALELLNGKKPFEEIFIQYGLGTTLIHSFILFLFEKNIFSIVVFTSFIYSISLYLIGDITYKLTKNFFYSLFSSFSIFLIYPWPTSPWPNFISFFFIVLFYRLYISGNSKKNFISGILLGMSYFSLTIIYNFVILLFLTSLLILFYFFKKQYFNFIKKNFYMMGGFFLIICLFLIYLIYSNLFETWFLYQKIPFILSDHYDISLLHKIYEYIIFLYIYSFSNFIYEPQFLFYSIIFTVNIGYLIVNFIYLINKNYEKINQNLLVLNLLVFSLNFKSQLYGMDKLATSLSLGVITLFYTINNLKKKENRFILNFIISFIIFYSLIFSFEMTNSHFNGNRYIHYQDLKHTNNKFKKKDISYFSLQKWDKNTWHPLIEYIHYQKKIKKACNIEYAANLTSQSYFYVLFDFKKIQLIPFIIQTHKEILIKYFEPNLIYDIQKLINDDNILILTFENNEEMLELQNYYLSKKINLNKYNGKIPNYFYIYLPKKCILS